MATIGQLNATTQYFWQTKTPVDILNKQSALLWKLCNNAFTQDNWDIKPHEIVPGGLMIEVPFKYQGSNRGGYNANTIIDQSKKTLIDALRFKINSGVCGSNTLNLNDKIHNAGEQATIDLTKQYIDDIMLAARIQLAEDIISGSVLHVAAGRDPSEHINGLGDLFSTVTATEYGSIAEDNIPQWKANVITTVEDIGFATMQKIWAKPGMGTFKGLLPNFICTTTAIKDGYELSLHPSQISVDADIKNVAGFDNIVYKGAPMVSDPYYDANLTGVLDALNLDFMHLKAHKDRNFTTPVWSDKTVLGQPDVWTADTRFIGNLITTNRQLQVRHTGLTVPV